ncbi:MAG: hypothetical protein DYG86_17555 [Chloroflexi bacterium CFX2]|nr:hypothetical protein [Chloroflexi bacterium CFX2]
MKAFKRIILRLLAGLAILILFIPLSIFVDGLIGGDRVEKLTNTTIPGTNGGPVVRAYVAEPEGEGPFPTVIMIHEFFGLNESIISKADLLARKAIWWLLPIPSAARPPRGYRELFIWSQQPTRLTSM